MHAVENNARPVLPIWVYATARITPDLQSIQYYRNELTLLETSEFLRRHGEQQGFHRAEGIHCALRNRPLSFLLSHKRRQKCP